MDLKPGSLPMYVWLLFVVTSMFSDSLHLDVTQREWHRPRWLHLRCTTWFMSITENSILTHQMNDIALKVLSNFTLIHKGVQIPDFVLWNWFCNNRVYRKHITHGTTPWYTLPGHFCWYVTEIIFSLIRWSFWKTLNLTIYSIYSDEFC